MERFLDVREVVENAMWSLDNTNSRDRVVFRQWAYVAMRQIGFSFLNIKEECVPVCGLSFEKPCDLVSTIEISLVDNIGSPVKYRYISNRGLLPIDESFNVHPNSTVIMSEDANYYYLSSNASTVVQAQLKYYGLPINEEGMPLIPEIHLLAVMSFIEFMFIKRKRASTPKLISGQDMSEFRDIWQRELMKAKGKNKMPSIHQSKHILKDWMTLINKAMYKD